MLEPVDPELDVSLDDAAPIIMTAVEWAGEGDVKAGYELLCTAIRVAEARARAGDQVGLELAVMFHGAMDGFLARWPLPEE